MNRVRNFLILVTLLALPTSVGCVGLLSNLIWMVKGPPRVPAEFATLPGKRVAVTCMSASNTYGPGQITDSIARAVESKLRSHVEEVDVVGQDEVADWLDHNDWNHVDYTEIGRGVKADYLVAIELNAPIRLNDGPTLHRGQANFTVTVYDVAGNGKAVFRRHTPEFAWPSHGRDGVSDVKFRQLFLDRLTDYIARYFYEYEMKEDFGQDAAQL